MHSFVETPSRPERPNRVFVVGPRGIPNVEGGVEKNTERLFPLLVQQGYSVTLVALEKFTETDGYRGVKLIAAPSSRLMRTDKLALYLAALRHAWRERPHVVHMQGLGSAILLWAYRLMGAKTVVRYGAADYLVPKWGMIGKAGFLAAEFQLRFADAVIAVTPALADRLAGRGIKDNVIVIPNAIDDKGEFDTAELPEGVRPPYLLAVGRVTEQKNIHRLAEGFNRFAKAHPEYTLVVAGGIDDEAYLEQLRPHLNERIVLLGRLPRAALGTLYSQTHLYVNSSMHEGNSNAVLEAISWDCPILLSGIVENRDFGLAEHHHFDQEDPAAIAAALAEACADPARFKVDKALFPTWRDVADRTAAIYERLGMRPALPATAS